MQLLPFNLSLTQNKYGLVNYYAVSLNQLTHSVLKNPPILKPFDCILCRITFPTDCDFKLKMMLKNDRLMMEVKHFQIKPFLKPLFFEEQSSRDNCVYIL